MRASRSRSPIASSQTDSIPESARPEGGFRPSRTSPRDPARACVCCAHVHDVRSRRRSAPPAGSAQEPLHARTRRPVDDVDAAHRVHRARRRSRRDAQLLGVSHRHASTASTTTANPPAPPASRSCRPSTDRTLDRVAVVVDALVRRHQARRRRPRARLRRMRRRMPAACGRNAARRAHERCACAAISRPRRRCTRGCAITTPSSATSSVARTASSS